MCSESPGFAQPELIHIIDVFIQAVTTILVAFLVTRAKRRDREEAKRNGNGSNGH